MKIFKQKTFNFITICIISCMLVFAGLNFIKTTNVSATNEPTGTQNQVHSVFIHKPTHSFIANNKLYFVDEYDKQLKSYDLSEKLFSTKTLSLSDYTILDLDYLNNHAFLLASNGTNNSLIVVNLTNLTLKTLTLSTEINQFKNLDIESFTELSETKYLIGLTPTNSQLHSPIAILLDDEFNELNCVTISPIGETGSYSMIKFLILKSSETNYHFLFTYPKSLYYSPSTVSTILSSSDTQSAPLTQFPDDALPKDATMNISDINLILIKNKDTLEFTTAFIITFNDQNNSTSIAYRFSIDNDDASKSKLTTITSLYEHPATSCYSASETFFVYPNAQQIYYQEIIDNNDLSYTKNISKIENPEVCAEYYSDDDYKYMSANKKTALYPTPWCDEPLTEIEYGSDVIIIGKGVIESTNEDITDHYFCLFTKEDTAFLGYISTSDLAKKATYENQNYIKYKNFKVVKNTKLYSKPTMAEFVRTEDKNVSNFGEIESSVIQENSKVSMIDTICKFSSNGRIMLKVLVNDTDVGYINADSIIFPNPNTAFIITNATITHDNTKVYREDGSCFDVLEKGFRVRINGARDTKTGYTSVSYNDEYGNEYTGYIMTDAIKTNTWSTLQILGSVLIAINIGLLILIIIFKNRKIGKYGEKYKKEEKPNYKQSLISNKEE